MPVCLISLGSNEGNRQESLDVAVARLAAHPGVKLIARSSWRETAPIGGPPGQADFLTGAAKLETSLTPHELLAFLQQIEDELGRRRAERWGPRPIDLDLLLYDDTVSGGADIPVCQEERGTFGRQECLPRRGEKCELVLPHPRMAWRRFVLEPAAEVAGSMVHPTTGWSIARLLAHLNDSIPYVAITGPIAAGKSRLAEQLVHAISAGKKGAVPICRNGPEGASHKRGLSPFFQPARLISERPDWSRLDAFYADPAGHAWATELEFLDERTRLLERKRGTGALCRNSPEGASHKARLSPFSRWAVSDFWFDQSAAFARAWLPAERLGAFLERYEQLRRTVVRPRLIVLLDAPADELLRRVRRRGRECERRLTADQLERIRQAVVEQTARPDVGSVLRADSDDPDAVLAEVLAAVQAME